MDRMARYAKEFADMAEQFQQRGDMQKMTECLVLAAQCLQAARALQAMGERDGVA